MQAWPRILLLDGFRTSQLPVMRNMQVMVRKIAALAVRDRASTVPEDMLNRMPDTAVRGHPVGNGPGDSIMTAAQAEAWFWPGLSKALAVGSNDKEHAV
jgi:hypothetical protein